MSIDFCCHEMAKALLPPQTLYTDMFWSLKQSHASQDWLILTIVYK